MWEKVKKLIDVKSIVTLALTFTLVFAVLSSLKIEDNMFQLFSWVITSVFGFYFGRQSIDKGA
jgi:hypothetical protein